MSKTYHSIYAPYIEELIAVKRNMGFKYTYVESVFSDFDQFILQNYNEAIGITKVISEQWCKRRENESASTHYHRCILLNSFSSFLSKRGIPSYIIKLPILRNYFVPYIFTHEEIAKLFWACDNYQSGNNDLRSSIIVMPALMRTLYATGMRISEAVSLNNKDINLKEDYCILRDTKNGEDRLIPFDTTLSTVLKEYVIKRDKLPIRISLDSPFFVTLKGSRCNKDSIYRRFRKILQFAGIPKNNIRLHDLRHTFAVHSLAKMVESGMDLYCALPILSTYLGHKSYQATNNYVRLTEDIYPNLLEKVDAICFNVFPKI